MNNLKGLNVKNYIFKEESRQRWVSEITWYDRTGKKRKKKITSSHNKADVKKKTEDFINRLKILEGDIIENELSFEEYAEIWLNDILKLRLKPCSLLRKEVTLKHQVYPYIGNIPITKVNRQDIINLIHELTNQELSFSTIKKAKEAVRGCIRDYCLNHNIPFCDPCMEIPMPENIRKTLAVKRVFSQEERELICAEAVRKYKTGTPVYRLGDAFIVLLYTGMRMGELLALTWEDVDFKKGRININKNAVVGKSDETNGIYTVINQNSTKTYCSTRIISMTKEAFLAMRNLYDINRDHKYVLSTKKGKQTLPTNFNRAFHHILRDTGILSADKTLGVHTLRHTFASMLYSSGVPLKKITTILGHADTRITENIYVHIMQKEQDEAIKMIDQYYNIK